MILYIIRHGEPIYGPDTLTELGQKQAQAVSRRFEKSGFHAYFKDFFISEEIGCQKPQAAFFDYVREHIPDWDADSTLVVGDSLSSDIQGAIDYNLDSCWYNPNYAPYTLSQACTYEIHSFDELKVILFEK